MLLYLLLDLHIGNAGPTVIFFDSQSTVHIANNPMFHERTKHIEIDCHIVREKLQAKVIHLLPVSSQEQLADFYTKPLAPRPFHRLRIKLGMIDIHASA